MSRPQGRLFHFRMPPPVVPISSRPYPAAMLLAIDIGNTTTVVGCYDGSRLLNFFRLASNRNLTGDEAGFLCEGLLTRFGVTRQQISAIAICSVVPGLTSVFAGTAERFFAIQPITISHKLRLPITLDVDQPEQVGADRIANAVAGYRQANGAAIVVDFGTATTFDVVTADGAYIGGVILPGPETAFGELARRAARLFEVRIDRPRSVVGRTTTEALQSGIYFGTIGQVESIAKRIRTEFSMQSAMLIATGGFSQSLADSTGLFDMISPTFTLDGIQQIVQYQAAQE